MNKFITAAEAATITKSNRKETVESELTSIYNVIVKSANNGDSYAYYCKQISDDALQYLRNAGFDVETYDIDTDGEYNAITW